MDEGSNGGSELGFTLGSDDGNFDGI